MSRTFPARSLSRSPSSPPRSLTQYPSPPRSLERDGQTRSHMPRLVVSRSTCPPLPPVIGPLPRPGWAPDPLMVGTDQSLDPPMGWWLGLHQPPWSFGFDSQTRGTRENGAPPCVKVPGSSRVPSPRSLVRDGQTSSHWPRLVVPRSTCPHLSPSPPPPANSFVIGTAVINTHGPAVINNSGLRERESR